MMVIEVKDALIEFICVRVIIAVTFTALLLSLHFLAKKFGKIRAFLSNSV